MAKSFPPIEKITRGKPFEGQKYTIGRRKYPKNHVKIKSASIRDRINLSRWIWPINGPDLVGISQVGGGNSSDMIHRRWAIVDIAIGVSNGAWPFAYIWAIADGPDPMALWILFDRCLGPRQYRYRRFQRGVPLPWVMLRCDGPDPMAIQRSIL